MNSLFTLTHLHLGIMRLFLSFLVKIELFTYSYSVTTYLHHVIFCVYIMGLMYEGDLFPISLYRMQKH